MRTPGGKSPGQTVRPAMALREASARRKDGRTGESNGGDPYRVGVPRGAPVEALGSGLLLPRWGAGDLRTALGRRIVGAVGIFASG